MAGTIGLNRVIVLRHNTVERVESGITLGVDIILGGKFSDCQSAATVFKTYLAGFLEVEQIILVAVNVRPFISVQQAVRIFDVGSLCTTAASPSRAIIGNSNQVVILRYVNVEVSGTGAAV